MSYYVSLYAFSTIFALFGWTMVFRKYRNPSGLFFLLFAIFACLWFILYFLFFSGISDQSILLLLSRIDFWIAILGAYSLLWFIYFFNTKPSRLITKKTLLIFSGFAVVMLFYVFTDFIVAGLTFDPTDKVYREVLGNLIALHLWLHFTCVSLFFYFSFKQLKKQTYLNRIRLKHILVSAFLLLIFLIVFQLILPALGIWLFEKEVVFSFTLFVLYINFTVNRYYFSRGYSIGSVSVISLSVILAVMLFNLIKTEYLPKNSNLLTNYWALSDNYSVLDPVLGIAIFLLIHFILRKIFLGSTYKKELKNKIQELQISFSYATSFEKFSDYVGKWLRNIFKTGYSEIVVFPENSGKTELQRFFENNFQQKAFVNDFVFIEEHKTKFDRQKILGEIPDEAFLILPIFNKEGDVCTAILILGTKLFGDFYNTEEIEILRDFALGLGLHIKYIRTYGQIRDLSINLDKKVDEKTMEYNNLINKQKEFISVISHEIRSPISTAIFQADSLVDDIENSKLSHEELKSELVLLNNQLIKTGELISTLFSVQYFDVHSVSLFRENVQIGYLLQTEYEVQCRMHEHIKFINKISDKLGFASVDRIQLQQVVSNLLGNAVKFLNQENPVIIVEAKKKGGFLHIAIEDSGKGFEWIEVQRLFEKYSTFGGESSGLGMWLYLCKKIVELHGWEITASASELLGWAKFTIRIPVQ